MKFLATVLEVGNGCRDNGTLEGPDMRVAGFVRLAYLNRAQQLGHNLSVID
jgi:hypothetical protein